MQRTLRTPIVALLLGALVTGFTWLAISQAAALWRRPPAAAHRETVVARQREWARDRVQRQVVAHSTAWGRARRHEQELEAAMGGPVAAAAHKPELSIRESMEHVAVACAPGGTEVRVHVDRFTEFSTLLELPRRLDASAMADLARCILSHHSNHVYRLQFSYRGNLLAEFDRRAIESVADWRKVTAEEVQSIMASPANRDAGVVESGVPPARLPSPENQAAEYLLSGNLPAEERRKVQAEETFRASMQTTQNRLRSAMESRTQASDLSGVHTSADLDAKRALLQEAILLTAQARAVLADPADEYRRILREARLDEVYVRSALRTVSQKYDPLRGPAWEMLNKLSEDIRSRQALLDALSRHPGLWKYDSWERRIAFESLAARREIGRELDQVEVCNKALASAVTRWSQILEAANNAPVAQAR